MLFVADTNILISFFNEESKARGLATSPSLELLSPQFALHEINKYKQEILEKFSLSEAQFTFILRLLSSVVQFVRTEEYARFLSRALRASPDPDDIDFFALALKLQCPLWSNERKLRRQSKVKVLTTEDVVNLLKL